MKTTDFYKIHGFWWKLWILVWNRGFCPKLQILMNTGDFYENCRFWSKNRFKLRNCKKHISNSTSNRTTSNSEIHRFLSEMKDHLPKKVTPIFALCTFFKIIWPNFIIVCPNDSFQDHLIQFYHCIPNWLLSRPYDLIFGLCTQLTPFNTIWPNFIIVYPIDSFQDHLTSFYHSVPIDSFQDHLTSFYHCVPNWLLSRPFDPTLSLCTLLTPFVLKGVNLVHNAIIRSYSLERSQLGTQCKIR